MSEIFIVFQFADTVMWCDIKLLNAWLQDEVCYCLCYNQRLTLSELVHHFKYFKLMYCLWSVQGEDPHTVPCSISDYCLNGGTCLLLKSLGRKYCRCVLYVNLSCCILELEAVV